MKNVKLIFALLLAVAVTAPAFAQSQDPHYNERASKPQQTTKTVTYVSQDPHNNADLRATLERAAIKAQKERAAARAKQEREEANCSKCGEALTNDERWHDTHTCKTAGKAVKQEESAAKCVRCGKKIESAGQHCDETGCTALCTATVETERAEKNASYEEETNCSECGEALTNDERWHNTHNCKTTVKASKQEASAAKCVHCGKKIESAGQHCEKADFNALCTATVETKRAQNDSSKEETSCSKCGAAYTVDEMHHGYTHECANQKKADDKVKKSDKKVKEYCIHCGEEIVGQYQHCSGQEYNGICTPFCPECGANLNDPKNVGKDSVHHCKFKAQVKVAKPIKK